jgi:hypothetical protein
VKRALVAIVFIWLPCALAALVAIPVSLVAIVLDEMPYGKHVLRAMDRLAAAVLMFDGERTVSAECGRSECRACKWLCAVLNLVEKEGVDHCRKAAQKEE